MSARRAWRIRKTRRIAWEAASDVGLLPPRRQRSFRMRAVRGLRPKLRVARLQPVVQRRQRGKGRSWLPEPIASVLDVFLDLPLLPPGRRKWLTVAEKRVLTWRSLPRPTLSTAVRNCRRCPAAARRPKHERRSCGRRTASRGSAAGRRRERRRVISELKVGFVRSPLMIAQSSDRSNWNTSLAPGPRSERRQPIGSRTNGQRRDDRGCVRKEATADRRPTLSYRRGP